MVRRYLIEFLSHLPFAATNEWMRIVLEEFKVDAADFIAFSPKYAPPYQTNLEAKIDAAKNVVPDSTNVDIITGLTAELEAKMDIGRIEVQKFFNFVVDVFPHDSAKLNQAGKNDYLPARQNYEKMMTLLKTAKTFADDNAAALTAKGYTVLMAAKLETAKDDIQTALDAQNKAQKERPVLTEERRKTVNDAYEAVRDLCEDAKIIYVHDYAMFNKYLLPGIDSGTTLSGTIAGGEVKNILHRAFGLADKLLIKNAGTVALEFCLSPDEISASGGVRIEPGLEKEVSAADLGDIGYHYLNVKNGDIVTAGKYSVKIL